MNYKELFKQQTFNKIVEINTKERQYITVIQSYGDSNILFLDKDLQAIELDLKDILGLELYSN